MTILAIETSCDETGVAIVSSNVNDSAFKIRANVISSSLELHSSTGGIIPETAAREQLRFMLPVLKEALQDAFPNEKSPEKHIGAIAVTYGPGLIGSLLVGVETAKTLSYIWNKALIPVNHLYGHIYANWLAHESQLSQGLDKQANIEHRKDSIRFPALALVVSGGHTDLVLMKDHASLSPIGATRDDAAGEAFDKIGRLLGLPYPAGPIIANLANSGDYKRFTFPRPMIGSMDFDFSFSGLKTSVLHLVKQNDWDFNGILNENMLQLRSDICAAVQAAIVSVLVKKTIKAAEQLKVKSILLGGGVSANDELREQLHIAALRSLPSTKIFAPEKGLSTDNAAMIAVAAFIKNKPQEFSEITADPELYY